ncbi:phage SPO1 DNA polymerase-related protein [Isosphaera pallida ATCC 43644]|uniref:Type-4 uracil-DNA glycosylase n=1 Tax=Isosphaera pallida (strain ATCC 43644 / DSM 9630 / IS1B) TaxID=575540 RepID=E8R6F6_ISOPI|nr:uracil-DNA glycosylase [Isosphaera pallida]ADV61857.1 phage SPO1 DNA polymerase-related protein [Isosphaera pallida ATCC 43644]
MTSTMRDSNARFQGLRQIRQRLEALRLAGVTEIPRLVRGRPAPLKPSLTPLRKSVETEFHPSPIDSKTVERAVAVAASDQAPPASIVPTAPALPTVAASPVLKAPERTNRPTRSSPTSVIATALFEEDGFATPPLPSDQRSNALTVLAEEVSSCQACPALVASRTQTVFGVGSPTARLMFIGEAPGEEEDAKGVPFVGRAGQLLTDMIVKGMGLTRDQVYIANACKCRPTDAEGRNRTPDPSEIRNCASYLDRQIEIVRPEFLCLLGKTAAQAVLGTPLPLAQLRKRLHRHRGMTVVVTFHPAYLLRNPSDKKEAWEDLKMLMSAMGLKPPGRS